MAKPINIGILGFGYLGEVLFKQFSWGDESWVTITKNDKVSREPTLPGAHIFEWQRPSTWNNLPQNAESALITIPPVLEDREAEKTRLDEWCLWMRSNRPGIKSMVYISSSGVYPDETEIWTEEKEFTPDTNKGGLRFDTESILEKYFDTRIIRPGAIYGPERHIGLRALHGKPIPQGNRPVHRIHVDDLARIVAAALIDDEFPAVLNAVDLDPASSETVVGWLFQQGFADFDQKQEVTYSDGYYSRKQLGNNRKRLISNQLLLNQLQFRFIYPTYKEGLTAIVQ